jgi:hypothetical protein
MYLYTIIRTASYGVLHIYSLYTYILAFPSPACIYIHTAPLLCIHTAPPLYVLCGCFPAPLPPIAFHMLFPCACCVLCVCAAYCVYMVCITAYCVYRKNMPCIVCICCKLLLNKYTLCIGVYAEYYCITSMWCVVCVYAAYFVYMPHAAACWV